MTYKKIILGGLLLSMSSISFCEETIIGYILKKIFTVNATLLQSKPTAAQPPKPTNSPVDPTNNSAGAAGMPNNNHQAPPRPTSGAAEVAKPPIKPNALRAKEFLKEEANQVQYDLSCGKYSGSKSAACVLGQSHRVILIYIKKNFDKNETFYLKQIEKYIIEKINDLSNEYNNPYFDEISDGLDWYDSLANYKKDNLETINRYKQVYKNIFGKNI